MSLLTCPFCGARFPGQAGLKIGARLNCERCGERFSVTDLPGEESPAAPVTATVGPASPSPVQIKPRRSNLKVAAILLAGMTLMAGLSLTYALLTVSFRRDNDKAISRKPRRPWLAEDTTIPEEIARAPGNLTGLGYLPPETGILVGLQIEELLASPAGRELRSRTFRVGKETLSLERVSEWTGLPLESMDHVLLGVVIRDDDTDLTPPLFLVVRTRKDYDPSRVRLAFQASRPREETSPGGIKRSIFAGKVGPVPVQLWLADSKTFVVAVFSGFDRVPRTPHDGLSTFGPELRRLAESRLTPGLPAFLLGHSADWKKTWLPTLLKNVQDVPLLQRLEDVTTFGIWLVATQPTRIQAAFHCRDEDGAKRIEQKVLLPRVEQDQEHFSFVRDGSWLDLQLKLEGLAPPGKP